MLGIKTPTTTALTHSKTMLTVGTMLRITPNAVQRHLDTFCDASVRATWITDADGILVLGSMHDTKLVRAALLSCSRLQELTGIP